VAVRQKTFKNRLRDEHGLVHDVYKSKTGKDRWLRCTGFGVHQAFAGHDVPVTCIRCIARGETRGPA